MRATRVDGRALWLHFNTIVSQYFSPHCPRQKTFKPSSLNRAFVNKLWPRDSTSLLRKKTFQPTDKILEILSSLLWLFTVCWLWSHEWLVSIPKTPPQRSHPVRLFSSVCRLPKALGLQLHLFLRQSAVKTVKVIQTKCKTVGLVLFPNTVKRLLIATVI